MQPGSEAEVTKPEFLLPRLMATSTRALVKGWTQTLELLETGELSNSELDSIMRELPLVLADSMKRALAGDPDQPRLYQVLRRVVKAMEKHFRSIGLWHGGPR